MTAKTTNKKCGGGAGRGYPDLQEHIAALIDAGLLRIIDKTINKDTEMHPLVRWQFRGGIKEAKRKGIKPNTSIREVLDEPGDGGRAD